MSYTENNFLNANSQQSASNGFTSDKYQKLMLALAAVMGVIGSAAVGAGTDCLDAAGLYQMTSVAFPQLTAWLISYMMYQNPNALPTSTAPSAMLQALPEASSDSEDA